MAYSFSILRFVPDTARGEFINIGAVAGDPDAGDWDLRLISNIKRAKAIDGKGLLPAAMAFVAELGGRLPDDDGDAEAFTVEDLAVLSAQMNNVVQLTPPEGIVAEDAAEALDILADSLLFDLVTSQARGYKNVRSAVGATNRAYREVEVPADAIQRDVAVAVQVDSGTFTGGFDFAVRNGRAVQV